MHPEMWKDPPTEAVIRDYENNYLGSLARPPDPIPINQLVPDWSKGIGTPWNTAVFSRLAQELHTAIIDGGWDEVVPGLSHVRQLSHPGYLQATIHSRFYRFRREYGEQRPIISDNEADRRRAIKARSDAISEKYNRNLRRNRRDSRKSTVRVLPFEPRFSFISICSLRRNDTKQSQR